MPLPCKAADRELAWGKPLDLEIQEYQMLIAPNVVVHDPETDLAKVNSKRLREHGWPASVVQAIENTESATPMPTETPDEGKNHPKAAT
jgi:hypothetical protein